MQMSLIKVIFSRDSGTQLQATDNITLLVQLI